MLEYLKQPVLDENGMPTVVNGKVMTRWSAIWRAAAAVGIGLVAFKGFLFAYQLATILDGIN